MIRLRVCLVLAASFTLFGACTTTDQQAVRCANIPTNGCPEGDVDVCADPTCAAAYACNPDGSWTLDRTCPGFVADAGPHDASPIADALPPSDAPPFDAPAGANGGSCTPPLQDTDCTLGEGLACASTLGCCGCQTLFVCQNDTWVVWGECEADGGIVASGN